MSDTGSTAPRLQLGQLPRRRRWTNTLVHQVVRLGGAAVIGAIALIFLYLVWVVAPAFAPASVTPGARLDVALGESARLLDVNESGEIAMAVLAGGSVEFFSLADGELLDTFEVDQSVERAWPVFGSSDLVALRSGQELLFLQTRYVIDFDDGSRRISAAPQLAFEGEPIDVGAALAVDVWRQDDTLMVAAIGADRRLRLQRFAEVDSEYALEPPRRSEVLLERRYNQVYFGPRGQWLFLLTADGRLDAYDLARPGPPVPAFDVRLRPEGSTGGVITPLLGRYSWLVGGADGVIHQFVLTRDEYGYGLKEVRRFDAGAPVQRIVPEARRKGFLAFVGDDTLVGFYTTSQRRLFVSSFAAAAWPLAALAPRSNLLLLGQADGQLQRIDIHNEHPEMSFSALWSKVWYEGYEEPVYSWQSSSADNDFEAKFSLTPLLFGTLKAAFYAMLFAVPIAIMGALYTAYFMHSRMRAVVKPGIEIMAALPTVILGFLAGLWLAPLMETHLAGVLTAFVLLPPLMIMFAFLFSRLPDTLRARSNGWYGAITVPLIIAFVWLAFTTGPMFEDLLFGGDARTWLRTWLGLDYDQRNALVVGIAMGLAVIPTIFSIAEDAVYGVPNHLKQGSLALGATEWQTLMRVVLLTASPGIFSAIMIGLGRAVGETMIVLMATGNTPVMNMNIFEGMRTFAANIAVELPESEVDSTHYRILFLAALVLFMITFAFNTVAELVRQRLRVRYGSM